MLDKLKSDFDDILELVNKAPQALQETAFKIILERWFAANAAAPPPPSKKTKHQDDEDDDTDTTDTGELQEAAKKFMAASAVSMEQMDKAFHPVGTGAQLLISPIPGNGKALQLINLAVLLCVRQMLETGTPNCTLKSLREMAVHYDCYDSTNFSKTLKTHKGYFKPRAKGADIELSGPGFKKAAALIKASSTPKS